MVITFFWRQSLCDTGAFALWRRAAEYTDLAGFRLGRGPYRSSGYQQVAAVEKDGCNSQAGDQTYPDKFRTHFHRDSERIGQWKSDQPVTAVLLNGRKTVLSCQHFWPFSILFSLGAPRVKLLLNEAVPAGRLRGSIITLSRSLSVVVAPASAPLSVF